MGLVRFLFCLVVVAGVGVAPVLAHDDPGAHVREVAARDALVADQENLLNAYRCRFKVDLGVVPGACPDPDQSVPGPVPADPADGDIADRDRLVADQEMLLNAYRCRFGVDLAVVPAGGCDPSSFSAEELGCAGAGAPCVVDANGVVHATRVVGHEELVAPGGFEGVQVNPYAPDVPESVALRVLTGCLRSWDEFAPSPWTNYRFTAPPVLACNAVWLDTAYAINHLGAADVNCAWGHFEELWLRGGNWHTARAHTGWAGPPELRAPATGWFDGWRQLPSAGCASWLDPRPDRDPAVECARLGIASDSDYTGNVRQIAEYPGWEEHGLTGYLQDRDGNFTDDWWKPTYCVWMGKCVDLVTQQVAPEANWARAHNSCDRRIGFNLIAIAQKGRCAGLKMLADAALLWSGGAALPHVAERPRDQLVAC